MKTPYMARTKNRQAAVHRTVRTPGASADLVRVGRAVGVAHNGEVVSIACPLCRVVGTAGRIEVDRSEEVGVPGYEVVRRDVVGGN